MTRHSFGIGVLALALQTILGANTVADEASRHLPAGAVLASVPKRGGDGSEPSEPAAISAWLGRQVIALVYRQSGNLTLRVVPTNGPGGSAIDVALPGNFLANFDGSTGGLLARDVLGSGSNQIVVVSSDGASAGSYLNVFALDDRSVVNVVHDPPIAGYGFELDCRRGSPCKIISYGKWVDHGSSTVDVYEKVGNSIVETDSAGEYYDKKLAALADSAVSGDGLPVFRRVKLADQVAVEYVAQYRFESAIDVCNKVLALLGDPSKSVPRSVRSTISAQDPTLESDIREGTALVHEIMARIYSAENAPDEAAKQLSLAQAIRLAKE